MGEAAGGWGSVGSCDLAAECSGGGAVDQVSHCCCEQCVVASVVSERLLQIPREDLPRRANEETASRAHHQDSVRGVSVWSAPAPPICVAAPSVRAKQGTHDLGRDAGWGQTPSLIGDGLAGVLDPAGELRSRHHVTERAPAAVGRKGVFAVPGARDSHCLHTSSVWPIMGRVSQRDYYKPVSTVQQ